MAQVQPLEAAAGRPLTSSSRSAPHDKASINHSLLHNHSYKKAQARIDRKLQAGSLRHPTFGTSHGHKKAESERRQRTKKALAEAIHYLMFLTLDALNGEGLFVRAKRHPTVMDIFTRSPSTVVRPSRGWCFAPPPVAGSLSASS